jgi:lysophospholipase L1-like esterase
MRELNGLLAVASGLVGLAIVEMGLRAVDKLPLLPTENLIAKRIDLVTVNSSSVYDPLLGWIIKPGIEARADNITFYIGEFGVRMNQARIDPVPRGAIVASGDSFTAGSEVADAETWPAYLQKTLGTPVVNAAAGAWGSDQIVLRAEQMLSALSPHTIIVSFLVDDIQRSEYEIFGGGRKPYFTVEDGTLVHHNNPVVPLSSSSAPLGPIRAVLGYSHLANTLATNLGYGQIWWDSRKYVKVKNDYVQVSCLLLKRLRDETAAAGVRLLFVLQYGGNEVSMWPKEPSFAVNVIQCAQGFDIPTINLWDTLKPMFDTEGVPGLRPLYVMHGEGSKFEDFGHMSPAGNRLVAQLIAGRLRQIPDRAAGHAAGRGRQSRSSRRKWPVSGPRYAPGETLSSLGRSRSG